MAGLKALFNRQDVIRYYLEDRFNEIPKDKLHNIIINIFPYETEILANWERHFQGKEFRGTKRVPHAVVKTRKLVFGIKPVLVFEIWAEKIVGRNHHKEKDKKKPGIKGD